MAKVYIGVGHGGSDPGAVANGVKEKDLNLSVAKACQAALKRSGVETKISRTSDVDGDLNKKIKAANDWGADLALDIHHNAGGGGGGDGAEVYHSKYLGKGATLAKNILNEIVKIGQNSRGTKIKKNEYGNDYFGFIRLTNMPSVLVECAFIDNKTDVKIVDTEAERVKMGEAIAKGICTTLGITYVATSAKPSSTSSTIKVGSTVKINSGARTYDGVKLASFVYNRNHKVKEVKGNRVVVTYLGIVVAAMNVKDLTLVK